MTTLNGQSEDILKENIAALRELFPEVCCEDKIDFDKLKQVLGEYTDDSAERYNFTWNGKGQALRLSQTPSMGTLRPFPKENESKNWDDTQNLYIEGDNLEVLKLLQKSYHGKVKMIYIDPPYNTGSDFVYPDDFSDSLENYKEITGQVDAEGRKLSTNSEANGRYHTDWLNMMYPRLRLARNLLTDDGVIFISIDDNEVDNLRKICGEVFGESNFIAQLPRVTKRGGKSSEVIAKNHDYVIMYRKSDTVKLYSLQHDDAGFCNRDEYFEERGLYKLNQTLDYDSLQYSRSLDYPLEVEGEIFYPGSSKEKYLERQQGNHNRADWAWRWSKAKFDFGWNNGFVVVKTSRNGKRIYTKTYQKATIADNGSDYEIVYSDRTKSMSTLDITENDYSNDNATKDLDDVLDKKLFDYSKPIDLIKLVATLSATGNDIILDFFSGSATTAHAVMKLNAEDGGNRKFIMVQLPEPCAEGTEAAKAGYKNICEIGKERIRRAGEKIKAEVEQQNAQLKIGEEPKKEPDIGFKDFKLDTSNLKKWQPDADDLEQSLFDSISNYVPERSELDVVYEIMLKMGLDLTWPLETRTYGGKNVYAIGMGALMICLDDHITPEVAEGMVALHKELDPETWKVVFKDNGFADDSAKVNIKEILKCAGLEEDAFTTV